MRPALLLVLGLALATDFDIYSTQDITLPSASIAACIPAEPFLVSFANDWFAGNGVSYALVTSTTYVANAYLEHITRFPASNVVDYLSDCIDTDCKQIGGYHSWAPASGKVTTFKVTYDGRYYHHKFQSTTLADFYTIFDTRKNIYIYLNYSLQMVPLLGSFTIALGSAFTGDSACMNVQFNNGCHHIPSDTVLTFSYTPTTTNPAIMFTDRVCSVSAFSYSSTNSTCTFDASGTTISNAFAAVPSTVSVDVKAVVVRICGIRVPFPNTSTYKVDLYANGAATPQNKYLTMTGKMPAITPAQLYYRNFSFPPLVNNMMVVYFDLYTFFGFSLGVGNILEIRLPTAFDSVSSFRITVTSLANSTLTEDAAVINGKPAVFFLNKAYSTGVGLRVKLYGFSRGSYVGISSIRARLLFNQTTAMVLPVDIPIQIVG